MVDLKNGSYKKIDKFNYFLLKSDEDMVITEKDYDEDTYVPKYFILSNVGFIQNKIVVNFGDICIDSNGKTVQDDQKQTYFTTSYYDLGNGNYITCADDISYLTNKSGTIKKVYSGNAYVLYDSKLIALIDYDNDELKFIDFKGNYVSERNIKFYDDEITIADDKTIYYQSVDGKLHLITLDNGAISNDTVVDYEITSILNISSVTDIYSDSDRHYKEYGFYYTAKAKDTDNDDVEDVFDVTYYTTSGNSITNIANIQEIEMFKTTNLDGEECFIAVSRADNQTTDFSLRIDILSK